MKKKKYWIIGGIAVGLLLLISIVMAMMMMLSNKSCKTGGTSDIGGGSTGGGGAWTQVGTEAYKNAEATFKSWTSIGMSGAQAAGIVGNIGGAEDPGFVLDQAEIGAGAEGGGGLYQFTPKSKYLTSPKSDKSWSVENQRDVVMALEPQTVKAYFKETKGGTPEDAATAWMNGYERPSPSARANTNSARRAAARTAYELFGGANISGSDSILGDAAATADDGSNAQNDENQCSSSSAGSGGDWDWPFASIKNNNPSISGEQLFGHSTSRTGNFHDGVDFGDAAYGGQEIKAIHGGTVYKIGHSGTTQNDLGYYICVKSDDGYYEVYQEFAFSDSQAAKYIKVKEGDTVKTGDTIGTLPKSGSETSPLVNHVHIGVSKKEISAAESSAFRNDGTWLDPVQLIKDGQSK